MHCNAFFPLFLLLYVLQARYLVITPMLFLLLYVLQVVRLSVRAGAGAKARRRGGVG